MFEGFHLKVENVYEASELLYQYYNTYDDYKEAQRNYEKFCESYREQLELGLNNSIIRGTVNMSKLESAWFQNINADIFLSHSHFDEEFIVELAAWLNYSLKLRVFIDSRVWGYCEELIEIIDDEYCKKDTKHRKLYDYDKRNQSTKHVYMLLNGALTKMIDKTECFIFVGTTNSLDLSPSKIKDNKYSTFSPWIYSELLTSNIVRRITPDRLEGQRALMEGQMPLFRYSQDLSHLRELSLGRLLKLQRMKLTGNRALDKLYENNTNII